MTETVTTFQGSTVSPVISRKAYSRLISLLSLITLVLTFSACYSFVGMALVPSESMEPTLNVGDRFMYNYTTSENLTYDDIVVFFPFAEMDKPITNGLEAMYRIHIKNETVFVKRIIGLPGDVLEMKDGYVYRNGEKLNPDYLAEPMITNGLTYVVPDGQIFCMGDNRNHSNDSRYLGAFPANNFFGRLCAHIA